MLWTVYCKTRKVCVMCFVYCVKLSTLSCSTLIYTIQCVYLRAQNLRQVIVMKTSFKTRVLRMGLSSFVDIDIFVMKYFFLLILHFSRISQIKIYKMLRPQKGNSRVSLNDTLLNFGLRILISQNHN